ncbi:MAG: hypothetical protein ACLR4W_15445 [Oscillospiraceae bacterium]
MNRIITIGHAMGGRQRSCEGKIRSATCLTRMAATRAEIAAMLHRFIEKYELVQGKAPGGLMGWIDSKRLQIPKTGDSSVLGLWGVSLCTSLAGCLALTIWRIRRWREEEALQLIEK